MAPDRRGRDRRSVLAAGATLLATALAGCGGSGGDGDAGGGGGDGDGDGGGGGDGGAPRRFGGWMDDVSNDDGVVDETGAERVTVEVGVEANDGSNGFGPAAVAVSPGTTVVWEWTGDGLHNVVAEDGSYGSSMDDTEGKTFEHTFEGTGTSKYVCEPHRQQGMKGVVVVE